MSEFNQFLTELLRQHPGLGVAVMMNNYFHDVATALLAASAFCLYAIDRVRGVINTPAATIFFLKVYKIMVKFFRFALWWIVIGGIPRTIFFRSFEWSHFADQLQIPALMVKHILFAIFVIWGIYAWRRLKRKVADLSDSLPPEMRNEV